MKIMDAEEEEELDWDSILPLSWALQKYGFTIPFDYVPFHLYGGCYIWLEPLLLADVMVTCLVRLIYVPHGKRNQGRFRRAFNIVTSTAREKEIPLTCLASLWEIPEGITFRQFIDDPAHDSVLLGNREDDLRWEQILIRQFGFTLCPAFPVPEEARKQKRIGLLLA